MGAAAYGLNACQAEARCPRLLSFRRALTCARVFAGGRRVVGEYGADGSKRESREDAFRGEVHDEAPIDRVPKAQRPADLAVLGAPPAAWYRGPQQSSRPRGHCGTQPVTATLPIDCKFVILMFGPALAEGNVARPEATEMAGAEAKAVLEGINLRGSRSGLEERRSGACRASSQCV